MIAFIDFVPQIREKAGFFGRNKFEELENASERMNEWVRKNSHYDILNIETVVLPNIHSKHEEGSTDVNLSTSGEYSTDWHQFIRVWYRS